MNLMGRTPVVIAMALAVTLAGCVGGSNDDAGDDPQTPETTTVESLGPDGQRYNATQNATYLNNTDYRQDHVHDYWNDRSQIVLVNDDYEVSTFCCRRSLDGLSDTGYGLGGTYFSLPNNTFVPEGTGTITVEIDATAAAVTGQNLVFEYSPDGWGGQWQTLTASELAPTLEFDIQPEHADLPHARSTTWLFGLTAGSNTVLNGEVHLKITAEKVFDVEAWPQHPDFWSGGEVNRLDLMNETTQFDITRAGPQTWFGVEENEQGVVHLPDGAIVPPETSAMLVRFTWDLADGLQEYYTTEMGLDFRMGQSAFRYAGGWCFLADEGDDWKQYVIPVDETSVDSPYADSSAWAFRITSETGLNADQMQASFLGWAVEDAQGEGQLDVKVYRETPQWLQDKMDENTRCFN